MLKPRTLKLLSFLVAAYVLLVIPGAIYPAYFESSAGYLVLVPYLSILVFHRFGIPGLLQNNGLCGWGWCSPTLFGWVFAAIVWLLLVWGIAWAITALTARFADNSRVD